MEDRKYFEVQFAFTILLDAIQGTEFGRGKGGFAVKILQIQQDWMNKILENAEKEIEG